MRHSEESSILNPDKSQKRSKRYSYYEIFSASTIDEKSNKLIEFLSRDDVNPFDDFDNVGKAIFQKNSFLHIAVGEAVVKTLDEIIIFSVSGKDRDIEKLNKYLKVFNKLSLFFSENPMFLDQLFDELKRVLSTETIMLVINSLADEPKLKLIDKLLKIPYWRENIPQLELYDTFS